MVKYYALFHFLLARRLYVYYSGYMAKSEGKKVTNLADTFLEPVNSTHRQYEALRAYFVDRLPSAEVAERFGYTPGAFRVLCHQFRQNPRREFFLRPRKGPRPTPEKERIRQKIVALRKRNLSVYDISRELAHSGDKRTPAAVSLILKQEGFARLPRRKDDERPTYPRPETAAVANVNCLDLTPRSFRTQFGGLFLFLPYLVGIDFDKIISRTGLPGSKMIPGAHAMRSLLALKLFGRARHSHVMSYVMDEGLALFPGLNEIPKRAFLTEYSCRINPSCYPKLMRYWFDAVSKVGLERGTSFNLDFHTIPFHGEDALVQKHYITKRSRRQKGVLAFLFVRFWKKRTGEYPEELIFDSKLTTYANLNKINNMEIDFITLRRRSPKMLAEIAQKPRSAWKKIQLEGVGRIYSTPRILDQEISLTNYEEPIRQITIADLGHEEPTLLLTNQLRRSPPKLITRYAQRMVIENSIEDGIDFFHMDALSSAVAMKVNCDLQLTLMASSLYRLFAFEVGNGYQVAKSRHIFRDFIDAVAKVTITKKEIFVRFQKRAHNPLLLAAGFHKKDVRIPWLKNKRLRLVFG
jgi:hypothetical protein